MNHPRMMTHHQFMALLRAASSRRHRNARRDRFLFYLLGKTGLRISEALQLRITHLHLDQRPPFLRVQTLKQRIRRRAPAFDDIDLEASTVKVLQRESRGRPGWEFLLPRISRHQANHLFRYYARRAELPPGLTLHSLRHYRGSRLYNVTKDLRFTQQQMRHRSIVNTQVYLHTDPDLAARHLVALDRSEPS